MFHPFFSNEESIPESGVYKSLSVESGVYSPAGYLSLPGARSEVKINEGERNSKPKFKATPITRIINSA